MPTGNMHSVSEVSEHQEAGETTVKSNRRRTFNIQ